VSRFELEGLKDELSKTKKELDGEVLKSGQLFERVSSLNGEVSKYRVEMEKVKDQNEKDVVGFREKIVVLESENRELEKKVEECTSQVGNQKTSEK
jgi:hypothetical protein